MNKTILQEIYEGKIYPADNIKLKKDEDFREIVNEINKETKHLLSVLSDKDKKCVFNLESLYLRRGHVEVHKNFTYGFRLGMSLMIEMINSVNPKDIREEQD